MKGVFFCQALSISAWMPIADGKLKSEARAFLWFLLTWWWPRNGDDSVVTGEGERKDPAERRTPLFCNPSLMFVPTLVPSRMEPKEKGEEEEGPDVVVLFG